MMHGNRSGQWYRHGGAWRSMSQHVCGCVYQREYGCARKGIHRHAWGCACQCDWRKKKNDDEVGKGGRQEVVDTGMRSGLQNSFWAAAAGGARCPGPYPVSWKWQGRWRYGKELRKRKSGSGAAGAAYATKEKVWGALGDSQTWMHTPWRVCRRPRWPGSKGSAGANEE